jgi:hypothetical protein
MLGRGKWIFDTLGMMEALREEVEAGVVNTRLIIYVTGIDFVCYIPGQSRKEKRCVLLSSLI